MFTLSRACIVCNKFPSKKIVCTLICAFGCMSIQRSCNKSFERKISGVLTDKSVHMQYNLHTV